MTKVFTTRGLAFWLSISLIVHLLPSAAIMALREEQRVGDQPPFTVNLAGQTTGISGPDVSEHPARNRNKGTPPPELSRVATVPPPPLTALPTNPIPTASMSPPAKEEFPPDFPIDAISTTTGPVDLSMPSNVANQGEMSGEAAETSRGLNAGTASGTAGSVASPTRATGEDPVYPPQARINGWEGEVWLQLQVAADGSVTLVTIEHSSRHEELDLAAAGAVKRWKFHPARRNGTPVEATVRLPIAFRLQAAE